MNAREQAFHGEAIASIASPPQHVMSSTAAGIATLDRIAQLGFYGQLEHNSATLILGLNEAG